MNSWTGDVDSDDNDDGGEESNDDTLDNFRAQFEKAVRGTGSVNEDLPEKALVQNIEQIEDKDLLKEGWLQSDGEKRNIIEGRIGDLGGSVEDFNRESEDEVEETSDDDGSDDTASSNGWGGSDQEPSEVEEDEGNSDSSDTSESSSNDTTEDESDSSDDSGWGSSDDEDESEDEEAAEPAIESVEEIEEDEPEKADESAENESESDSEQSSGPPVPSSAVTPEEAAKRDQRWKVLVWGPPKIFKTHFCYTMPEPIAYIDTEGKADDIARKFEGKDMQIWQPKEMTAEPDTKFRRAKKALDEALEWLDWHREHNDQIGTIVVDSMTLMWEWAQRHHKIENYPLKDPDEVELSANFKSSQESDWAVVKEYHNGEFRERISDSPYHFCWTAMEREAFEETIGDDENRRFLEPIGERDNDYKADSIIRARKDKDRGKVGDLVGCNLVDNTFVGLNKPTFPKVRDAIEAIQRAESSENPKSRSALSDEIEAETIIDYDPQVYVQE